MQNMLDWDSLRYFLAASRGGTLSAAGRALRVDQTTVGRRLAALEAALGARLFDRGPDGLVLTPAGAALVPRAERIEAEGLAVERELGGREGQVTGTVRITTPEAFGNAYLAARLVELHRRHPTLTLELVADNRAMSLSKREADLALRLGRPAQLGLVVRRVATVASALYAAPGYVARRPAAAPPFAGHDLVGFDDTFLPREETAWLAQHVRGARTVLRCTSTAAMAAAAAAGLGLALLPCYIGDRDERLRRLPPTAQPVVRGLWLVVHRDLRHAARIRAVGDGLAAIIAADARLLAGRK
jgi:DNA-binding transcriptional LysR family regulator